MNEAAPRIALVVPTKDHPDDLSRLLRSLAAQTVRPLEVVVVDGGSEPLKILAQESFPFPVRYERVFPPGLAKQQNAGARRIDTDADLVGFLDDDMVLEPNALEAMLSFWRQAAREVGGAAFNLVNNIASARYVWAKALFGMDSVRRGVLLPSGYQTRIGAVNQTMEVEWLYGGATVWRKMVVDSYPFDEWFEGPGHLYELDFSFRVGQCYKMFVVADAKAQEVPSGRSWMDEPLGRWQILNRLYFVRKHRRQGNLSLLRCWVALGCQVLVNLMRALIERDLRYWNRTVGNCKGLLEARKAQAPREQAPVFQAGAKGG